MKRIWIVIALMCCGCADMGYISSTPSRASPGSAGPPEGGIFSRCDFDRDGRLSREEADRSLPRIAHGFGEADINRDGYLTYKEVRRYFGLHRWESLDDRL